MEGEEFVQMGEEEFRARLPQVGVHRYRYIEHGGRGVCTDGEGGVQGLATPGRSPYIYCRYIEQEHGGRGVCLDGGGGVQGPATPGRSA